MISNIVSDLLEIIHFISMLFVSLFLLAIITILYKLWWVPNRISHFMALQGIKGPSYKFLYGNFKDMINMQNEATSKPMTISDHNAYRRLQPHISSWTNLYGNNYLEWTGPQAQLVITEPELVKEVLIDRENVYPKMKLPAFVRKILGDGLVLSEGEKWAKMRKIANPTFQVERLKNMVPAIITSTELMLKKWKHLEGQEIDVYRDFKLLTSDVISRAAFGSSYEDGKVIFDTLEKLNMIASNNLYKLSIPIISKIFKSRDAIESERLDDILHQLVAEKVRNREEKLLNDNKDDHKFGNDFLGAMLTVYHNPDEKKRISFDEIVDECKSLYFGGQETTSTLLAWTVFVLAVHTDWQERARKEVLDLFGKEKNPNADGISKLKSVNMILNETLRLYPPVIAVPRKTTRRVKLGNMDIPKNVSLHLPILALHHNARIWGEDVHLFKPDRFSEGVSKATKNNSAAFLPFGTGSRNCIGFNFALNEVKIALAMILQRYSFTLSPTYVHSPVQVLLVRPEHGVQLIINSI